MAERRRYERFDVSGVNQFVGQTDCTIIERRHVAFDLDIQTMSIGGCGFYATTDGDIQLKLGDRLSFHFSFRDEEDVPVTVKGDIVSIIPQYHSGRPESFYAVRFINVQHTAIDGLLNKLADVIAQGKKAAG